MKHDDAKLLGALVCFSLAMILLVDVFGGSCGVPQAAAQVPRPADLNRVELALARGLAQLGMNEAGTADDTEMITQTVFAAAPDTRSRLQWLRDHSPCVLGVLTQDQAYERPGNCRWSRNLHPDGRRPRGWDRNQDGHWSRTRPRWTARLEQTIGYVRGTEVADICPEPPESWDGRRTTTAEELEANGWRVLECDGDLQNFPVVRVRGAS